MKKDSIDEKEVQHALGLMKVFEVSKTIVVSTKIRIMYPVIASSKEEAFEKFNAAFAADLTDWACCNVSYDGDADDAFDDKVAELKANTLGDLPGDPPYLYEDDDESIFDMDDYSKKELKHFIQ